MKLPSDQFDQLYWLPIDIAPLELPGETTKKRVSKVLRMAGGALHRGWQGVTIAIVVIRVGFGGRADCWQLISPT
jgi:hypothetical protein